MKNQTFIVSDKIVSDVYTDFISDKTIFGISTLWNKYHLGSKSGTKVRNAIYQKYGEENIKIEAATRRCISMRKKVTGNYRPTLETLKKRSESAKKTWAENPHLIEIARGNGRKTFGRVQSEEEKLKRANSLRGKKRNADTKLRMSLAKKGKPLSEEHKKSLRVPKSVVQPSYIRSEETKNKISKNTKQHWKDGVHKPTYRSKGQIEMENIIKSFGYEVKPEFLIEGRPYDTLVVDKNLLIEYNGTFWHRDPRFFPKEMTHKGKCLLTEKSEDVWKRNEEKINLAKKHGYDIIVIWQYDWEQCPNKEDYIKNIFKNHGK